MTTKNNKPSKHDCLPCDIPPFCRNNYFTGKLLTERDFTAEQQYTADKLRLHHLALHGWGVVCGLKVTPHPVCPALRLVVEPGLAVDGCGREIRVTEPRELELPAPSPFVTKDSCPLDPGSEEYDQNANEPEEPQPPDELTVTLYVYLRYVEWEAELMSTPFNECGRGSSDRQPNRIRESYELKIVTEEPDCFKLVRTEKEACDDYDSDDIYKSLLDGCANPSDIGCIPLAVIRDFIPGQELNAECIHNRVCRRLLPSTTALHLLIRGILKRIPTRTLTRVADIGWNHRGKYHCHDFMKMFIGGHGSSPGFEITFDGPVRAEGITERTFQAIAVRYPEKMDGAGQPEVVPANVLQPDSDPTKVQLHIDPQYARNRLDRTRFDLYLLLRCNFIVDERGFPVDGELLAKLDSEEGYVVAFPTGDGIPGGLFESWIRVFHGESNKGGDYANR
jgi:hypothetical protein